MYRALASLGIAFSIPGVEVSRRENMREVWQKAGLQSIDSRVIRIPVVYRDFEDFWQSFSVPEGPSGSAMGKMSPSELQQLKMRLHEQLSTSPDGPTKHSQTLLAAGLQAEAGQRQTERGRSTIWR